MSEDITTPVPSRLEQLQAECRAHQEELRERARLKAKGLPRVRAVKDLDDVVARAIEKLTVSTRQDFRDQLAPALASACSHLNMTILAPEFTQVQKSRAVNQVFALLKSLLHAETEHQEKLNRTVVCKAQYRAAMAAKIRAEAELKQVQIQIAKNTKAARNKLARVPRALRGILKGEENVQI